MLLRILISMGQAQSLTIFDPRGSTILRIESRVLDTEVQVIEIPLHQMGAVAVDTFGNADQRRSQAAHHLD